MTLRLEDIELIKQLKYRYCRFIDTADVAGLETVLTEDIVVDYVGATYHFHAEGRDEVVSVLNAAFHEDFVGCHTVHQPEITVLSDTHAEGRWTLTDYAVDMRTRIETTGACLYRDEYRKVDGAWRIARSAYRRLYERVETLAVLPNFTSRYLAEKAANPEI
ncbi:nuclear transport factor 2 family protein [Sphingomonas sp. C3-2]|uniref:nuclear transport factor 2 family protein n=1 Tax=Sphingomonas sp. C3-2 TaxID=3062169 RepID=UPI00294ABE56|nr:nuclear transport factor 2 family protein [Sphingomonas sp. C3-2]WOK36110.1 nuclear transport factor 2 family protein [Sphingomonas sp. C3-2]